MFLTRKRVSAQTLLAVSALFAGALLTGCSEDSSAASSDPSASSSPKSGFDQALAHAQCMRENGVPNYPDPKQDANGRVNISPGEGVDPNSQAFRDASQACRDLQPQGQGGPDGGGEINPAKVAKWAKCMRANGLPKFPDPEINGNELTIDVAAAGIKPTDGNFQKAQQACQDKFPGGMVRLQGPGPGDAQ
ncbi:hypothetical protein [Streptomyces sp. H27-D2]|uniref:hypothetical protein n=1 Tax=Streptomyces sp. H27-D2 TaxID=3046304 RepID=UPI002DB7404C|nr:hypothetical protein [Streptomyces sp. H27-D2]MEC4016314.1 hypothetical protein [Streptomyces sp. H27-D2]